MRLCNEPIRINLRNQKATFALPWGAMDIAAAKFLHKKRVFWPFRSFVAVARGGLVPATVFSHYSGVRTIHVIRSQKTLSDRPYDYGNAVIIQKPVIRKKERVVVIEDIIYEGQSVYATIQSIQKMGGIIAGVVSLVVDVNFLRENSPHTATPFLPIYACGHESWMRFPWEKKLPHEKNIRAAS